jgi:hypothetical protein
MALTLFKKRNKQWAEVVESDDDDDTHGCLQYPC